MDARERQRFKKLLLKRRAELLSDVEKVEEKTLRKSRQHSGGELSSYPDHIADLAADNYGQEFVLGLLESEKEELQQINEALAKLGDKTFGKCETCTQAIDKDRLLAIPYAKLCIECQRKVEAGLKE